MSSFPLVLLLFSLVCYCGGRLFLTWCINWEALGDFGESRNLRTSGARNVIQRQDTGIDKRIVSSGHRSMVGSLTLIKWIHPG